MTQPEIWDINSVDHVSTENPDLGSEYGGVGGIIQPPPHNPTASERLTMIYAIDPDDDGTQADSVVAPEQVGDFSSRGYR
jgi:hypothetical protein